MYTGRTIFSQLMDFLPRDDFHRCVQRYNGNHKIKTFSCLDQYLCMADVVHEHRWRWFKMSSWVEIPRKPRLA